MAQQVSTTATRRVVVLPEVPHERLVAAPRRTVRQRPYRESGRPQPLRAYCPDRAMAVRS